MATVLVLAGCSGNNESPDTSTEDDSVGQDAPWTDPGPVDTPASPDGGNEGLEFGPLPDGGSDIPPDAVLDLPEDEAGPTPLPAVDYMVVCANDLVGTAQAFATYRQETEHVTEVVTLADLDFTAKEYAESLVVEAVHDRVRETWDQRNPDRPFYLLIVGDAEYSKADTGVLVPAPYEPFGWDPGHSDNGYADMDGDHVPDLAVGRIPVRSDGDGLLVLDKVKHHESHYEVGPWNRRLSAYAGEGDFGPEIDGAIELVVQKVFEALSYDWDIRFAYASNNSVYYYTPFKDIVLEYLTHGSLLTAYMGHGGGETNVASLDLVLCQHRCPMLAFFACGTGDFLMLSDSDPEILMKQPGAPFEFVASQPASHPYGNAILARELEVAVMELRVATYGEAFRLMKWRSMYHDDEFRQLIDAMTALFIDVSEMEAVKLSHMYTYNLLGDPALSMRYPEAEVILEIDAAEVPQGTDLGFQGTVAGFDEGTAHLTLEVDRITVPWDLEPVPPPNDPGYAAVIQSNHAKALKKVVAEVDVPVTGGAFQGTIPVPKDMPLGKSYLKALVEDGEVDGIGHHPVLVVHP